MEELSNHDLTTAAWIFLSLLARISPVLFLAPPTYSLAVPRRLRAALAGILALMLTPLAAASAPPVPTDSIHLALAWGGECLLGILLGSITLLAITSLHMAGLVIGHLAGFDLATSPSSAEGRSGQESPILVHLLGMIALVTLLISGGHRYFLQTCLASLDQYPIGSVQFEAGWLPELEFAVSHTLAVGIRPAAPFAAGLLMINIANGLIARALPQMNFLSTGFSVNSLALLTLLFLSLGGTSWVFQSELTVWLHSCQRIVAVDH